MKYGEVVKGKFISRYKRFSADVEMSDGRTETVHVCNTGRCAELLVPGCTVYLSKAESNGARKTAYDLIAVEKVRQGLSPLLINIDSLAPNRAVNEWLERGADGLFGDIKYIRRETAHGDSRFDFYVESDAGGAFVEVKGVTLESDGTAMFPDAPTERGIKHVNGLISCLREGYLSYIIFVIQMKGAAVFRPNDMTHPAFGDALRRAAAAGVKIIATDCIVYADEIRVDSPVKTEL